MHGWRCGPTQPSEGLSPRMANLGNFSDRWSFVVMFFFLILPSCKIVVLNDRTLTIFETTNQLQWE